MEKKKTTIRDQVLQLKRDKDGDKDAIAKNMAEEAANIEKATKALEVYTAMVNMGKNDWEDIIKFLLPKFEPKEAPSKLNSIVKVKNKLKEFEVKYGKPWHVLLKNELDKACVDNMEADKDQDNNDKKLSWSRLQLDRESYP